MKIVKQVNIDIYQDVEIDLSIQDIVETMEEDVSNLESEIRTLSFINSIAQLLKSIPDEKIKLLGISQKETIVNFFQKQIERFK